MAKLTARFDIQDKVSKKLRAIRGEIDAVERARARINKPLTMTMRIRDNATKILKRFHMFVIKDIAKTHTVAVQVKDKATKSLTAVSNFLKRRMPRTYAVFVSATDRATPILRKVSNFAQRNIARTQLMKILATDRAMPTMRRIGSFAKSTFSRGYNFSVRATDLASRVIGRVSSYATTAIPRVRTFTIRAINAASNVIGSVRRALFSIPSVITVTLAVVGLHSLGDATVGAAMNWEQYEVAMGHWLDDPIKSIDLIGWMGQFADTTPYSSPELFPALVEAVNFTNDDIAKSKRMLNIASDMAALTPGRTVEDAMNALSSVSMGEFDLLRGFGDKILQDDFKNKFGGDIEKVFDHVESRFADGAKKLSETSSGILATLRGYRSSIMRSMGEGFLGPMKPRLDAINIWLANNQDTWGRWKDTVKNVGEEASEWLFSKLETGFSHIKNNYLENDNFKKLDFEGKIQYISEDIGAWWSSKGKPALNGWWESSGKPWAEKVGLFIGESIFNGILVGITEGGKALAGMWMDAFKDPSLGAFGGAGVATMLAGMLSSLVLSPLIKAVSILRKGIKGAGKLGDKVFNWFNKERSPKQPKAPKPDYRMPWTSRGEKPRLNSPNQKGGFKIPKGLSKGLGGLGKFAKRIPVIGTALGALSILTASKEDKAGAIGTVGGGVGGAALGAAIGSVIPGLGTAIGGIIGGIAGSIGGGALGDWLSDNWTSIKAGATGTGRWIVQKFRDAGNWVSEKWSGVTNWFSETVWTPISDGVDTAVGWISDKWAALADWFTDKVWDPFISGADTAISFVVGLYDIGEILVKAGWNLLSGWFNDKVWTPFKILGEMAWDSITTKISNTWTGIKLIWGMTTSWFRDKVWTPFLAVVGMVWDSFIDKASMAWSGIKIVWEVAASWFDETIWTPLVTAVGFVGIWIGEKFTDGWNAVVAIWALATGWFEEKIWTPLSTAVEILGIWIGEKFSDGWTVVKTIWGVSVKYFDDNIWTPIKKGAALVEEAITTPFKNAWETVSGLFTKLGDTWDSLKEWGGNAVNFVIRRGEERRGKTPTYAQGTKFHPGGPAIVGDGGGSELIRYPDGGFSLSPAIDTLMNLPRGTEVLSHRKTMNFFNAVPAYAGGVGFDGGAEKEILSEERVAAATSSKRVSKSIVSGVRDVIVKITGENHYHDDMDAEKVGKVAVKAVTEELKKQRFEEGEMAIDE